MKWHYRPVGQSSSDLIVEISDRDIETVAREIAVADIISRNSAGPLSPIGEHMTTDERLDIVWPIYRYHAVRALSAMVFVKSVPSSKSG